MDSPTVSFGWPVTVDAAGAIVPEDPGRFRLQLAKHRMTGKRLWLELSREKRMRTVEQNSRYWALLVPEFSAWSGYEKDEAHEVLKGLFLKEEKVLPTGEIVERVRSTTELTVEEFREFTERAERFLVEHGVRLPADERVSA